MSELQTTTTTTITTTPQPEPIKVIFLRVPESLYLAAKDEARKIGCSVNEFGKIALDAWIDDMSDAAEGE